jgi:hypothetical protein
MSHTTYHSLKINKKFFHVTLEEYTELETLNDHDKRKLTVEIHFLLTNAWGAFPNNFVEEHIFNSDKMLIAKIDKKLVGICNLNIKNVQGKKIHYLEFLVIDKEYQNSGLGSYIFFRCIKSEIFKNIFNLLSGQPLEIFFITPNIRVLSRMARFSSFIYPNPYLADSQGRIPLVDQETWEIAHTILKMSDNPARNLEREGLVLFGSYAETPWLIYNNDNAPWHHQDKLNIFARRYLGYHKNEDKEFMVRSHLNIFSIFRYIFYRICSIFS